jgi:two-component system chemotaxis response regulator CheB
MPELTQQSTTLSPARSAAVSNAAPPGFAPKLVVLAASADGLQSIIRVLERLPAGFPVPIAAVLHRSPAARRTAEVLKRSCALHVKLAEASDRLEPGTVYLAPPDRHLVVRADKSLHLMDGRKIRFVSSSANPLFSSAAFVLDGQVVAVVLSGGGGDATDGVQTVKGMGGVVIAQEPLTAAFASMPETAIATGAVDYVLPLEAIAGKLIEIVGAATPGQAAPDGATTASSASA